MFLVESFVLNGEFDTFRPILAGYTYFVFPLKAIRWCNGYGQMNDADTST